jgi:hypothetical protein
MSAARLGAAALALVLLLAASVASAQDGDAEYRSAWLDAQHALAAFAQAPLAQRRRESERYASALAQLGKRLPPPDAAMAHWQMLPLHERALSAMKLIVGAAERGDAPAESAGWKTLAEAVAALQRTVKESQ